MGVAEEFRQFSGEYKIGMDLMSSISSRYRRITRRLNKDFWDTDSEDAHSLYVGSYGRDTAAKGISDLDIAFRLPYEFYVKFDRYQTNGQAALLQAVRSSLLTTYENSEIGGDGQVVVLRFDDGVKFEILPVFDNLSGTWNYPDTNNGGRWKTCNPKVEIAAVRSRNLVVNGNLKALCRMMRVWRDHNSAPMTGALIDALAYQFMESWPHRDMSFSFHDYMARDFLAFMGEQDREQGYWRMPGSGSHVYRTGAFGYKAKIDHKIAAEACELQDDSRGYIRRAKWRTVFGSSFPA